LRRQSKGEEIANSITHGLGVVLSSAGLALLIVFASLTGDPWRIVSFTIYGVTLILLYTSSVLYHSLPRGSEVKHFFHTLDHSTIYLLIAGTYTVITLVGMRGIWGWTLFGLAWGMAILGIFFRVFMLGRHKKLSMILYLAMGWMAVIAAKPIYDLVPLGMILWLILGGVCYTLGLVFFAWRRIPYHHTIWHIFVLAGSICHFLGIIFYMT